MDWIERLTGLEPDGGNGTLELAILLALVALLVMGAVAVRRRRGPR